MSRELSWKGNTNVGNPFPPVIPEFDAHELQVFRGGNENNHCVPKDGHPKEPKTTRYPLVLWKLMKVN